MGQDTIFEFTVNGELIKTTEEKLIASDIINLAIKNGAISGKPEDYVLEAVDSDREFKPDDIVDLSEFKEFITEKTGATPVADFPF